MKKQTLIFLLLIVSVYLSAQSYSYLDKDILIKVNYKTQEAKNEMISYRALYINKLVEANIVKGEYEKKATYQKRVKDAKLEYEREYPIERIEKLWVDNLILPDSIDYDSENDTYKLFFKNISPIIFREKSYAEYNKLDTENRVNKILFKELEVDFLNSKQFLIKAAKFHFPINSRAVIYDYNITNQLKYDKSYISTEVAHFLNSWSINFEVKVLYIDESSVSIDIPSHYFISTSNTSYLSSYLEKFATFIDEFQQNNALTKSKYETLSQYKNRIQINEKYMYDIVYDIFKNRHLGFDFMNYNKQEYDAENEVFKLYYENFNPIYIPCPIKKAPRFGRSLKDKKLRVEDVKFVFLNEYTLVLQSVRFENYVGEIFSCVYDIDNNVSFEGELISRIPKYSIIPKYHELIREEEEATLTVAQQMPVFPGGEQAMYEFLGRHLEYPQEAKKKKIQGRVWVAFVVNKDGSLSNIKVLRGIGGGCNAAAIKAIRAMPKWKPGMQLGKPVKVQYQIPIKFTL